MKTMYWHRKFLSRYIILFLSAFMIISLYIVEKNLVVETKGYTQKLQAAELTEKAFDLTQRYFMSKGYLCKSMGDVSCTGLIGLSMTEITTDSGDLYAKRSSVNPNMAAIFVQWLSQLNLQEGDTVAVQETGSYPALDIAMLSAIKTLKLKPLIIFSAGASQFGANRPGFTWPDIYRNLVEKGIFDFDVLGITLGGSHDNGYGMTPGAILKLNDAIKRNDFKVINIPYKDSTNTSVAKRLEMYKEAAGNDSIKAYINVGGNMASIGLKQPTVKLEESDKKSKTDKKATNVASNDQVLKIHSFPTGVTSKLPPEYSTVNSVAVNFLKEDIPVVNVRDINSSIIKTYGMTYNPTTVVPPGQGAVFSQKKYNTALAAALLIVDIALIVFMAFISRKYLISFKSK
ncbi:poly-gamma-glutamate system protein [Francisella philomiragia]|uniref:Poly-gamma-glutamate system family protein n=1 Tax=Francisella philomiragia subsp. philomiragia (strain ATCC 25017 / CCUG 19701 / FSC 153 / O\|nr:poly-gamma-glutamate system protein [Francisella philomiragia]AJI46342.1 poly-gamma-glutamate system family protein [Francisella philomiragia]AJI49524.1 poly-gamma-glutamate system family protein [Francisella philomiragia]MBK2019846.1 poly-gamma-glutamate system protein [Francisella philomiragia]MBK2029703.1 poly-gamma-glutamate system protein [Francisella philomiragia]MBK2264054.1 poly-gamma-glutamate system protein [Francisella philomiragia]